MQMRLLCAGALLALLSTLARADVASESLIDQATADYNLGDFVAAAEKYKAAYRQKPDSALLFSVAQSYRKANRLQSAAFFYRSYLREAKDLTAEQRQDVQRLLEEVEGAAPHEPAKPEIALAAKAPTKPAYKRWWVWTITGVAVSAIAVGLGVGLGVKDSISSDSHFGVRKVGF